MENKKAGRKPLGDEAYVVIETTFRTKRKHLKKMGKSFWSNYLRDCIKAKETELESK